MIIYIMDYSAFYFLDLLIKCLIYDMSEKVKNKTKHGRHNFLEPKGRYSKLFQFKQQFKRLLREAENTPNLETDTSLFFFFFHFCLKNNWEKHSHELECVQYGVFRIATLLLFFWIIWSFWGHWLLMSQHWDGLQLSGKQLWCESSPSSLRRGYSAIKPWTAHWVSYTQVKELKYLRVLLWLVWTVQDCPCV